MKDPALLAGVIGAVAAAGGLILLLRGFWIWRAGERVRGTASSTVASVASGEARIVGVVEAGPVTLVSPLQSEPCVFFRARIVEESNDHRTTVFEDERAVGFRVRDASGTIRVFPRGARFDVPVRFDEKAGLFGGDPIGLRRNYGPSTLATVEDPALAEARLLTVVVPPPGTGSDEDGGHREYHEERLAPGDIVTIVGAVLPFREIGDPATADRWETRIGLGDPEVALNILAAQEAGILRATPEEAWGNAAIPGFGIGRPVREPDLHPEAARPALASPTEAARATAAFEIPDDELVLVATGEVGLTIRAGTPDEVVERDQSALLLGLAGGIAAIAGAVVLALVLEGRIRVNPTTIAGFFGLGLLVVVILFFLVSTWNSVVALGNRADKAWGNIEVALRQRHDLIPALVSAVRDLMAFEREVLEEVTRQRARYAPDAPVGEAGPISAATSSAIRTLFAVAENYPQITSQENVLRLQGELSRLEEQIADRRELYNDQVYRLNTTIASIPAVFLAGLFGWRPRPFFEAVPGASAVPSVSLAD